ncbi:MAG: hypothetical protein WC537_02365, partial [Candidatus Paceibacterota bacterium]
MPNQTKTFLVIVVIALAFFLVGAEAGWFNRSRPSKGAIFKVGAVMPFTGSASIWGQENREGIDLAVEE